MAIGSIVHIIVVLLIGGLILGLLWWLITYCEAQFPGFPMIFKVIRIVFVFLVVLLLIGFLLQLIGYNVLDTGPGQPAQLHH